MRYNTAQLMKVKEKINPALASVSQLVGALSHGPKVVSLILSQGTYPGCGFNPWSGVYEKATN